MSPLTSSILTALSLLVGALLGVVQAVDKATEPTFEIAAKLKLPDEARFKNDRAFRSVGLEMPWVYVLERSGNLYVFRVPENSRNLDIQSERIIEKVGDGNDLKVFGDYLVFSRNGGISVYSLKEPNNPEHVVDCSPERKDLSRFGIVRDAQRAFLVGKDSITCYDLADPAKPKLVGAQVVKCWGWTGCIVSKYLYVSEIRVEKDGRQGIVCFDISDPSQPKEVGFVKTERGPYELFALTDGRLLASLEAGSLTNIVTSFDPHVDGNAAIYDLSTRTKPSLVSTFARSGGRSSSHMKGKSRSYFVCNGGVFRITEKGLENCFSFFTEGSNLDGLPYHGDADTEFAAVAADGVVTVLRLLAK